MTKPLSETHPTLWAKQGKYFNEKDVQMFTVDIAEHERVFCKLIKERDCLHEICTDKEKEVERLQKELEISITQLNDIRNEQFNKGLVEGERRAMERVKYVLQHKAKLWKPSGASENRATQIKVCAVLDEVWNELGLDEVQQ